MSENNSYKPEILSRQGEATAWALAAAAVLGLFFLSQRAPIPYWAWFLFAILMFSAASMSLGNWMDRKTVIVLTDYGAQFDNGLRKTQLNWEVIREVQYSIDSRIDGYPSAN